MDDADDANLSGMNDAVAERQTRLEAIWSHAVDAIITIDEMGEIDSVNPATERMFGYSPEELLGKNVRILMPEPFRSGHDEYLEAYRRTNVANIIGVGREVAGQKKDGTIFPVHLAVSELRLGERRMFTGVVRDISDVKAIERELERLNRELESRVQAAQAESVRNERYATLGKVAGGIAHEIRNPLNAVKMSAYFLLNAKQPSEEKKREHLDRIARQVTMIDDVVNALSDVAKLPDAKLQPTSIERMLNASLEPLSLPGNIMFEWKIPKDVPLALMDEQQVMIACRNLIRNATDAMPEGGTLTLSTDTKDDRIWIHVRDTGKGIAEDCLQQVLEPLYTTKARGMGLGLSISRTIVEKNQGQLHVTSELGKGSCFSIELRCVSSDE